jgi:phosphatidate cytidylyltransferase
MLINYLWFVNIIYNINSYKQITRIIFYNSVSDIIQYAAGKTIGRYKLFSFTSKSLEGYIAGIIATQIIFNYDYYFVLLNIIGMFGGIFSSIVKRRLKIKHWSNLLGPHGGINDRLDSLCVPIIIYLNFIK